MESVKNLTGSGYVVPLCGTEQDDVTPSDTDEFPQSNLYIGVSGDLAVALASDPTKVCIYKNRPVGDFPHLAVKVMATNTTADSIIRIR